jgi:SAM-dependent methyltransferase
MPADRLRAGRGRWLPIAPVDEVATLRRLWSEQRDYVAARSDLDVEMGYLAAHFAMNITLRRHLMVIDAIIPHVRGRVLEWGCRHGLDSCVYRLRLGDRVELHGCDVCAEDDYRPFHRFSGLRYRRLHHPYLLDYDEETFDVVTSNGVLEHVPDDGRSVAEVFRVLRPGGTFVVTCLPNRYSYTEALQRHRGATAHDRLYTLGSARSLLESRGFEVTDARRFLMVPTMLNGLPGAIKAAYQRAHRLVWGVNAVLERTWPLNILASNLMLLARKPGHASRQS